MPLVEHGAALATGTEGAGPGDGADTSSLLCGHSCSARVKPECVCKCAKGAHPDPGRASPAEGIAHVAGTTDIGDSHRLPS